MNTDLKIVIVEDDPVYQMFYVDSLDTRCNVAFCNTVSLAVSVSSLIHPNLFIVDLGLPDGDGVTAIEELKKSKDTKHAVIIVVTASTNEEQHSRAIVAGANEVLVKPLQAGQLISVIDSLRDQLPTFD